MKANVAKDVELKGGDTNADGTINYVDLGDVIAAYNSDAENCDISGDGTVNYVDLGIVISNYNATAVAE